MVARFPTAQGTHNQADNGVFPDYCLTRSFVSIMFVIIGSVVVLLSVGVGFIIGGGSLLLLWHPTEVLIIVGAAVGAFVTSNPPKVVKASVAGIVALLKPPKYKREDYVDIFKLMYDILVKARKEGMLAIEWHIDDPHASSLFTQSPRILADHHMTDSMP